MDVASHPRDRLLCLGGYQTVAAPVFASPFPELSSLPASRAHFPAAEAATLRSGTQQWPRGAQALFPGQCGWSWAPFAAPLSRTRSFQQAGMGEFMYWWPEGSVFPGGTLRDIVCAVGWCLWTGFPNNPCEAFQPQSLWKRRPEPHRWEHGTCQGVLDTGS